MAGASQGQTPQATDRNDDLSVGGQLLMAKVHDRIFRQQAQTVNVGRFVVLEVLGRGGAGVVYRAYDPKLDRSVALKVLSSTYVAAGRMQREAKALARLSHPNVVTIHEVDDGEDGGFVAMEYVAGGTLAAWCSRHEARTAARAAAVLDLARQGIAGLAAAHDLGVIHRDVKPSNMLVGEDGRLRVADFGLAGPLAPSEPLAPSADVPFERDVDSGEALTETGSVVGTPLYMAPEQFRGNADARSDQFGFCVTFWEALYGVRPFEGVNPATVLASIEAGAFVEGMASGVPAHVRRALERGLSPSPEDRFADMRALGAALERPRSRSRLGLAAAVVVLGGGAAGLLTLQPTPCSDEADRVAAAVAPERTAKLRQALLDSEAGHAGQTWTLVEPKLQAIADDWAQQRLAACNQARESDAVRAAAGRRQLACLDQAVQTLDRGLEGDAALAASQTNGLIDYVGVLADIADCSDAEGAAFDSAMGLELVAAVHEGRLAQKAGEFDAARRAFEEVLSRTQPRELPRLRATAHESLRQLADLRGDRDAVAEHAKGLLDEAEAADAPDVLARAWLATAQSWGHRRRGAPSRSC